MAKKGAWTERARERFLVSLAMTADIRRSAAAAGVTHLTVHTQRRRDPAFAYDWRMALLAGYDRIELALIRRALGLKSEGGDAAVGGDADGAALAEGELDVELALKLLTRHKPVVEQAAKEAKAQAFRASRDAAAAALLTKLRAHARRETVAHEAERARIAEMATPVRRIAGAAGTGAGPAVGS